MSKQKSLSLVKIKEGKAKKIVLGKNHSSAEHKRLLEYREKKSNWKHWGPYLSDRSWGTVREDYSPHGTAWDFFPHDHARSRVYRWGEDGIGGISDRNQYLCFSLAFWNGKDPILKERFFGVSASEGNHGEDVKELYFYLDCTPTHSYMKMLYKYPIDEYPYSRLVHEARTRSKEQPEFEITDSGIFNNSRYLDCYIEYAKADENDILIKVTIYNRSDSEASFHLLPTLWFRNTWSWGYPHGPMKDVVNVPSLSIKQSNKTFSSILAKHSTLGDYFFYSKGSANLLFTNNETNSERLFNIPNRTPYVKDAFHRYIINDETEKINPETIGTKFSAHYQHLFKPKEKKEFYFRLSEIEKRNPFSEFEEIFEARKNEADEFYNTIQPSTMSADQRLVHRQAIAGMLWSKQLFYYDVEQWLSGDPALSPPPEERKHGRNHDWSHLANFDIISMPDKWEFPWYAAWDLAFHCIPLSLVDADFAKRQLELMTREWYMHPNGQLPAYEWAFGDVNPPVHAWATWRVFKIDSAITGKSDLEFLEGIFHKLLLNFTWWVNRKDEKGNNIFQGGFLGLDNIGIFDRSAPLPTGGYIDQADGTSWMAAYCLTMLRISLELAKTNPVYQDSASKFMEHFLRVAHAMTNIGGTTSSLWDEHDGFFYDTLHLPDGASRPLKIRSLVGLLPLFAVDTIEPDVLKMFPAFDRRLNWFVKNRPHLAGSMARIDVPGVGQRRLVSLLTRDKLVRVLKYLFDENEFLSPHGIRSLSRFHQHCPFTIKWNSTTYTIGYEPGESRSNLFGGNSNWRGPVWFPMNYIIIEALTKYYRYYGDELLVEYPTNSGTYLTLQEIIKDLSKRLCSIFLKDSDGIRTFHGNNKLFEQDPYFADLILFNEYFHGDTGKGLGASHQTGWTGLVAKLLEQC